MDWLEEYRTFVEQHDRVMYSNHRLSQTHICIQQARDHAVFLAVLAQGLESRINHLLERVAHDTNEE